VVKESNQFNQFLTGVMRQGFKKIIIDFGFATYIDSIFVGVLVAAIKKIEAQACNIKLVVSDEKIFSNPIIASNLSRIFEIFTDIPTAISSFKDNG
jgi:anti-anti-sigma factor